MITLLRAILSIGVFSLGLISTANANLEARADGMVYDTDLNITWLSDANFAKTSGYDSDGLMNWFGDMDWASSLKVGGIRGWRLPTSDPDCGLGYNCTTSEMGHLFYNELGGKAGSPISSSSDPDLALFTHIQSDPDGYGYYSETTGFDPRFPFTFYFGLGGQFEAYKENWMYAWAVHDGDVGAGLVPEPEMYAMMSIGLLAMFGFRRLRQQH